MKLIYILAATLFVFSCQQSPVRDIAGEKFGKKSVRDYFKSVSEDERSDALSRAELFVNNYDPEKVAQINIVGDLHQLCGEPYRYQQTQVSDFSDFAKAPKASYTWPVIPCNYSADTEKKMSGGSAKFQCDFVNPESKDGIATRKIKYANYSNDPLRSEVVETIIAFNLAKLVGFHTNVYCPAILECQNCPNSTPWNSQRASVAGSNKKYRIEWSLIERPLAAYMVSTRSSGNAPRGVDWGELKLVKTDTEDERKRILIEREAWMLWIHFLAHTDAADFNQRLSCLKAESLRDEKYSCKQPILYTHDYGHAFYRHLDFFKWSRLPVFQDSDQNAGCRAGMTKDNIPGQSPLKGVILGAEISAEARDLLVQRLGRVTDDQWKTLYQLARAEEASTYNTGDFLNVIKRKIKQMNNANCLPFAAGKSVLAQ